MDVMHGIDERFDDVSAGEYVPTADERIVMTNIPWRTLELFLDAKGDRPRPKVFYLDGALELMSPSTNHEHIKTHLGRIIEAYLLHLGIEFNGFGAWTVRNKRGKAVLEPDECYLLEPGRKKRPDFALEVIWTSGGIDKLEVYERIGVPEVWFWQNGKITVHVLTASGYRRAPAAPLRPRSTSSASIRCSRSTS
jgi:Uma2 family endonuclease